MDSGYIFMCVKWLAMYTVIYFIESWSINLVQLLFGDVILSKHMIDTYCIGLTLTVQYISSVASTSIFVQWNFLSDNAVHYQLSLSIDNVSAGLRLRIQNFQSMKLWSMHMNR